MIEAPTSPSARRLAEEKGVDLSTVEGSGPRGHILKEDVVGATGSGTSRLFASPLARRTAAERQVALESIIGTGPLGRIIEVDVVKAQPGTAGDGAYEEVRLSAMRKTIARRMTEAKQTIPHFYLALDVNIDRLLAIRSDYNALDPDNKASLNDFIIKATAMALAEVPEVNVQFAEDHLRQYQQADIAVAVAIKGGLITPIIRDAGTMVVRQIAAESRALADRARAGALRPEEYQGGTISISNLGMYGIREFSAVINPPHGSILAIGAGEKRPVVIDDDIVAATMMSINMACDHRAMDGAVGAQFLASLKRLLEEPLRLILPDQ
jgi:pyruvate dehydrogenase E2 component (dihydrolipoamide acetyltransferase)